MHLVALFIFSIISNIVAFLAAGFFLPDFAIPQDFVELLVAGGILALLNMLLRPLLKLILGPIIFLTFGFGIILVNALILYLLDILYEGIMIENTITLIYATLIISAVNLVIHLAAKSLFRS